MASQRSVDGRVAPRRLAYFTLLAELMKTNPPAATDVVGIARFARIGLVPGKDFDKSELNASFAARIPHAAFDRIMMQLKVNRSVRNINGWLYDTVTGLYGTDYLNRALVTAIGLGANRPQDAVYPTSLTDPDGRDYSGANKYVMRFPSGRMPPAKGPSTSASRTNPPAPTRSRTGFPRPRAGSS